MPKHPHSVELAEKIKELKGRRTWKEIRAQSPVKYSERNYQHWLKGDAGATEPHAINLLRAVGMGEDDAEVYVSKLWKKHGLEMRLSGVAGRVPQSMDRLYLSDEESRSLQRLRDATENLFNASSMVHLEDGGITMGLGASLYVERDAEQGLMDSIARADSHQRPFLIKGKAGVGKTSLVWSLTGKVRASEREVWAMDAQNFATLVADANNPMRVSLQNIEELCRREGRFTKPPVLIIDTADVLLNDEKGAQYFKSVVRELSRVRLVLVLASRPEEAEALAEIAQKPIKLEDFSDTEFPLAVAKYAHAFIDPALDIDAGQLTAKMLDASAQYMALQAVARNPLMLRMLFTIYTPEGVNADEVNIVSLYRDFWDRRVVSDVRSERRSLGSSLDCSAAAQIIAVTMVSKGVTVVSLAQLLAVCKLNGVARKQVETLISRGVLESVLIGTEPALRFFHQTFMEHAAAAAIISIRNSELLYALHKKYTESRGDFFLGSILERVLVLAEDAHPVLDEKTEDCAVDLLRRGSPFLSPALFAFALRREVGAGVRANVENTVSEGNRAALERLNALAPNMSTERMAQTVPLICSLIDPQRPGKNHRWLELLRRSSDSHPKVVRNALPSKDLMVSFDRYPKETGLDRLAYFELLDRISAVDPNWAVPQIISLISMAANRTAGVQDIEMAVSILDRRKGMIERHAAPLAISIEREVLKQHAGAGRTKNSEEKSLALATIFSDEALSVSGWNLEPIKKFSRQGAESLLFYAHLNGLALAACRADLDQLKELSARSSSELDSNCLMAMAKVVWPKVLNFWHDHMPQKVSDLVKILQTVEFSRQGHSGATKYLMTVLGSTRTDLSAAIAVAEASGLDQSKLWVDHGQLYRHLVPAAAMGHPPAFEAFQRVVSGLVQGDKNVRSLLTQLRKQGCEGLFAEHALDIALFAKEPANDVADVLSNMETPSVIQVENLRKISALCTKLERRGEPISRKRLFRIVAELQRLNAHNAKGWTWLTEKASRETDAEAQEGIFRAIQAYCMAHPNEADICLNWLLANAPGKSTKARVRAFEAASRIICLDTERYLEQFENLFGQVFAEEVYRDVVMSLAHPLYILGKIRPHLLQDYLFRMTKTTRKLTSKTNHGFFDVFARLYMSAGEVAGSTWNLNLLRQLPGLHSEVARMLIPLMRELSDTHYFQLCSEVLDIHDFEPTVQRLITEMRIRRDRFTGLQGWPELLARYEHLMSTT